MEKGSVTSFPIKIQRPWTQSVIGRDLLNWENITTEEGSEKSLDVWIGQYLKKLFNGEKINENILQIILIIFIKVFRSLKSINQ